MAGLVANFLPMLQYGCGAKIWGGGLQHPVLQCRMASVLYPETAHVILTVNF